MNILWDFDGTLFDTYPVYSKLMGQILGPEIREDEIYAHLKISFTHAFDYLDVSETQARRFFSLFRETPAQAFRPFRDVEKVLNFADKNVIMTHNNRTDLFKILKLYGFEKYFADAVTSDDHFPRKPDPASYIYLNEKHAIDLVVGDRLLDIIPAKAIGAKTCLFQNKEPGADFYLDDYQDFFTTVRL